MFLLSKFQTNSPYLSDVTSQVLTLTSTRSDALPAERRHDERGRSWTIMGYVVPMARTNRKTRVRVVVESPMTCEKFIRVWHGANGDILASDKQYSEVGAPTMTGRWVIVVLQQAAPKLLTPFRSVVTR